MAPSLTSFDPQKQADDELWSGYVELWAKDIRLDTWTAATSHLFSAVPAIYHDYLNELDRQKAWLLSRVWPDSHPALRSSLENFLMVLNDLLLKFREHAKDGADDGLLRTEKFYRIRGGDPKIYESLAKQFDFHVALIHDLTLELTRAANYICDQVRRCLDRSYRLEEGALLVEREGGLKRQTYRPEYLGAERIDQPYPGLEAFYDLRASRDFCIGVGRPPDGGK